MEKNLLVEKRSRAAETAGQRKESEYKEKGGCVKERWCGCDEKREVDWR